MYASHASPWPLNHWTNTGVACAFWSGMCIASFPGSCGTRLLACATKYKKFEKESKAYVFRWKSSQDREHVFGPHRTWGYGRLSRQPHALFASLGAAALSRTHRSRCGLQCCGCIYALLLSSLPFLRQAPSSPLLPSQFLPFWRRDNETASAATVLGTKCTQLFVNRMF